MWPLKCGLCNVAFEMWSLQCGLCNVAFEMWPLWWPSGIQHCHVVFFLFRGDFCGLSLPVFSFCEPIIDLVIVMVVVVMTMTQEVDGLMVADIPAGRKKNYPPVVAFLMWPLKCGL